MGARRENSMIVSDVMYTIVKTKLGEMAGENVHV